MTQKTLSFKQLLLYIHGKTMVAKQRVKLLNRKWVQFHQHNHNINEKANQYASIIGDIRKSFSEDIVHFPHEAALMLELRNENDKSTYEKIIAISDNILNNASIVGMADLSPKAYKTLDSLLYNCEFENFQKASEELFLSLRKLKNECEQLGL